MRRIRESALTKHFLYQYSLFCVAALGECMVKNKINLIYGGGTVGLMGAIAKTVADGGCEVTGFLPEFFVVQGMQITIRSGIKLPD